MRWAAYYADGQVFTSRDGTPDESPKDLLIAIYQMTDCGWVLLTGEYFTYVDRWYQHDTYGVIQQFKHNAKEILAMRPGYYAKDKVYKEVLEKARLAHQ